MSHFNAVGQCGAETVIDDPTDSHRPVVSSGVRRILLWGLARPVQQGHAAEARKAESGGGVFRGGAASAVSSPAGSGAEPRPPSGFAYIYMHQIASPATVFGLSYTTSY